MRILYLSQYFPPEVGATQTRAYEMARNLARLGHKVTVIAEFPNHPSGIIPPAYRSKIFERDALEGVEVIRVWVKASPVKDFRRRMLFYLSYALTASLAGTLLARQPYDLVYVTSPPLFVGLSGLFIKFVRRIPMVFEVRDLWPESAVALGELTNPTFIRWAEHLEWACYRKAKRIVVVTQGIFARLVERGISPDRLVLIPNGANTELFQYNPSARERLRAELNLNDKFVAIYAGIHGIAQGLETVLFAARSLQSHPKIHFLFVGEGPRKAELISLARQMALTNVTFFPEQPRPRIPDYLSAADVALIPLRKIDLFKVALPSKIFDAWACQRPILLSVEGEARQILEACEGGLFVPPEDAEMLQKGILELQQHPELRERMGINGRLFTERNYSRKMLAEKLAQVLEETLSD